VRLFVNPIDFQRTKAGIIKEKNKDIAFKIMNDNGDRFTLAFKYDPTTHVMVVKLKQRLGIEEKVIT
jgi:hypothetical protein